MRARGRARGVPRAAGGGGGRCGAAGAGGGVAARRFLRPARLLSAVRGAAERAATCWSGRWIATSWRGRSSSRPLAPGSRSSVRWSTRWCPMWPVSPADCRCCRRRCWSCGGPATGARCATSSYRTSGGVRGAVARLAEDAYSQLGEAEQRIARGADAAARQRRERDARPPPGAARASSSASTARGPCWRR